jgi:MinD-like ATPase involved in chromosome partitioning or flagellar assembly
MAEPDNPGPGEPIGRRWRLNPRQWANGGATLRHPRTAPDDHPGGPRFDATPASPDPWSPCASVESTEPPTPAPPDPGVPGEQSGLDDSPETMALPILLPSAPDTSPDTPPDTIALPILRPAARYSDAPAPIEEDPETPPLGMNALPRYLPPPPFKGTPAWPTVRQPPEPLPPRVAPETADLKPEPETAGLEPETEAVATDPVQPPPAPELPNEHPSSRAPSGQTAPTFPDVVLAYVPPYPAPVRPARLAVRRPAPPSPDKSAAPEWQRRRQVSAEEITHESVVEPDDEVPRRGWRARLYSATGGRVNPGVGSDERTHLDVLERVRRQVHGARQVAVSSIKGGVGKTTVSACLGLMLAEHRGDGVIAVDADPDAGNLADRLTGHPDVTVRHLLADLDSIRSLSDFGLYTSLAGRLRVLASDQDPTVGDAFRRDEYERVCKTLIRFFGIVITDSGTGLVHDTMRGILTRADRLIVVGTPTVDGASRASKTLDWLLAHGHERLADDAVVVLSADRGSEKVNYGQLRGHFRRRSQHVIEVPADPHLYSGSIIDLNLLQPATRDAYLELAAVIADGFEDELFTFTPRD